MVKMDPIRSELKSRRIKWDKDTSAVNWAWLKEVRENNPTRRIYEENPYAEVYTFRENMYGIFTENADGHTDVWSYLILGPEKAMLIDTSFGIGNFKALADRLSGGREVIVANTHASYDHSYGNAWFDKAYCHKYIAPLMKTNQNPHIWDYLFDENGKNIWLDFDRGDLPPVNEFEVIPCENHHIFDLGQGYEVELIWMPGHQSGHAFFLDRRNRILFTGDGLETGSSMVGYGAREGDVYGEQYANVSSMYHEFKALAERMDEIDYLFPAHGILNVESRVLPAVLKGLEHIVNDPEHPPRKEEKLNKKGKLNVRCFQQVPGFTELNYNPDAVFPKK